MTRLAGINDISILSTLLMEYREFYGVISQNQEEIKNFLLKRIKNDESKIFITFEGDTAVGFIQLYPSFSTVSLKHQWNLNDLYVKKDYRRKGYATELMTTAKKYFKDKSKGFTLITQKNNSTAKAFYTADGWTTDEYDFYTFFF